ncbi:FMN-linked oxidoreductase, partial [Trichoderma citrinoviride]
KKMPPKLRIHPPLLNTASPWATSRTHLAALLRCPSLGAVTTRTSLLAGFPHDPLRHRYAFFDPATGEAVHGSVNDGGGTKSGANTFSGPPEDSLVNDIFLKDLDNDKMPLASLNTLGYSPLPLSEYLSIISSLTSSSQSPPSTPKTIIISITGSPEEISSSIALISSFSRSSSSSSSSSFPLAIEINLSCPNIPHLPPPAYSPASLATYLAALPSPDSDSQIPIGIKIPPYTHAGQFDDFVSALLGSHSPSSPAAPSPSDPVPASKLSFITATNTLGSSLLLDFSFSSPEPPLPDSGIGGMAGPPLHPLALGNVSILRRRFDADPRLAHLDIIGVGGVYDSQGYQRMRSVGAMAVGIATALGRQGVGVFTSIEKDIQSAW